MSCKHGNWAPCELCDEEEANWKAGYESAFKEIHELKELIDLIFSSTPPYINGEPTFNEKVIEKYKKLCPSSFE